MKKISAIILGMIKTETKIIVDNADLLQTSMSTNNS